MSAPTGGMNEIANQEHLGSTSDAGLWRSTGSLQGHRWADLDASGDPEDSMLLGEEGEEDDATLKDELDVRKRKWLLTYVKPAIEGQFWNFTVPSLHVGEQLVIAGNSLFNISFGTAVDYNDGTMLIIPHVVLFSSIALLALALLNGVIYKLGGTALPTARSASRTLVLLLQGATALLALNHHFMSDFEDNCTLQTFVDDERKVYSQANCYRFFQGYPGWALSILLLLQISFRSLLGFAIVELFLVIVFVFLIKSRHPHLANAYPAYFLCVAAFHLFVRWHAEVTERVYFEAHSVLQEYIRTLSARKDAMSKMCERLLPPVILNRIQSQAGRLNHLDRSQEAVLLSMSIHDFGRVCTTMTPLRVAAIVEYLRNFITQVCEQHGIERIAFVQDEVLAVGNLLKPVPLKRAVVACISGCLRAVEHKTGIAELPPLHGGVHAGPLVGGFVGRSWIRYDISGEALVVGRIARLSASASEVVITDEVRSVVSDLVEVNSRGDLERAGGKSLSLLAVTSISLGDEDMTFVPMEGMNESNNSLSQSSTSNRRTSRNSEIPSQQRSFSLDNPTVIQDAIAMAQDAGADGEKYGGAVSEAPRDPDVTNESMERVWLFFDVFTDPNVEAEYMSSRVAELPHRIWNTFAAYAAFQLGYLVFLFVDFVGPTAVYGALIMALTVVATVCVGRFPIAVEHATFIKHKTVWGMVATVIPLGSIMGCALTRPSAVGNDPRILMLVGAIVRSVCFVEAKYQLPVKIIMLVVSQLHLLFPGERLRYPVILMYWLVLATIVVDRDVDRAARRYFIVSRQQQRVLGALGEEQRVRKGLLRSTLPAAVYETIAKLGLLETARNPLLASHQAEPDVKPVVCATLSDTTVMLLSTPQEPHEGALDTVKATSRRLECVEAVLREYKGLTLVSVFGDQVLLIGPIAPRRNTGRSKNPAPEDYAREGIAAALEFHRQDPPFNVLIECDETVQVTRMKGVPSFSVFGVGATRALALSSAVDPISLTGIIATDRVIKTASLRQELPETLIRTAMDPWVVRGVGLVRLTRLSVCATMTPPATAI